MINALLYLTMESKAYVINKVVGRSHFLNSRFKEEPVSLYESSLLNSFDFLQILEINFI